MTQLRAVLLACTPIMGSGWAPLNTPAPTAITETRRTGLTAGSPLPLPMVVPGLRMPAVDSQERWRAAPILRRAGTRVCRFYFLEPG